jgi:general secretion pathway protein D
MNSRKINLAFAAAVAVVVFMTVPALHAGGPSAKKLYQRGQLAEAKDDTVGAYQDYAQAFKQDPTDLRYKAAMYRTRFTAAATVVSAGEKLRAQGDNDGALADFMRALEIDPSNALAEQDIQALKEKLSTATPGPQSSLRPDQTDELNDIASPVALKPLSNEPITLHSTEQSNVIYETIGKLAGINVLFDPDYQAKRIPVALTNVTVADALRIVATISGTFWKPVTANTIFVAQDTAAKHRALDEQAVKTFYLGNDAQQNDLNDIQTAIRDIVVGAGGTPPKLYAIAAQNALIMRATPDELLLTQKLIDDLDKPRAEVVLDVALLAVNRDKTNTIGLELPGSFGVQLQPPNATSTTSTGSTTGETTPTTTTNLTLNNLANLNGTNFAVAVGAATANLLLNDSDTKVLQNPSIRVSDGQQADLKVGEKIPVATGSYQTGAATAIVSSLVNTQFQYQEVGVEIKITPTIHYDGDITLKMSVMSSEESGSTTIGGITEPIISQDTTDQVVRLKNGEVNILGGFLQKENLKTVTGIPGLAELPLLKYVFGSTTHEVEDEEILFMITPHIIRGTGVDSQNVREIDTGTNEDIELRRISEPLTQTGTPAQPAAMQPPAATPAVSPPTAAVPPQQASPQAPSAAGGGSPSSTAMEVVAPATSPKAGSTFQVAINLSGGKDVFAVPLMLHYDPAKLSLINVDSGDFLGKDGQSVALVHRDDGHGMLVVSASRPPGVAGVNGGGTVCILTFKASAAGDSVITLLRASARNSAQQTVNMPGAQATVHVQ